MRLHNTLQSMQMTNDVESETKQQMNGDVHSLTIEICSIPTSLEWEKFVFCPCLPFVVVLFT